MKGESKSLTNGTSDITRGRTKKFDEKKLRHILASANKFVAELWGKLPLQPRPDVHIEEDYSFSQKNSEPTKYFQSEKSRARNAEELYSRLREMKGKQLQYKDKLLKKGIKNRLVKRKRKEERKVKKALIKVNPQNQNFKAQVNFKPAKPIFNSEGKMVFSKFDFTESTALSTHPLSKRDREERNPQKLLTKLERQKNKMKSWKETGEDGKVTEMKEKQAWKAALQRAAGEKVKDDPVLLKKTMKKKLDHKKQSNKKWRDREENVQSKIQKQQEQRLANINERKRQKKIKKTKRAVKRGRIIPGF